MNIKYSVRYTFRQNYFFIDDIPMNNYNRR